MKKLWVVFLALIMLFTACGPQTPADNATPDAAATQTAAVPTSAPTNAVDTKAVETAAPLYAHVPTVTRIREGDNLIPEASATFDEANSVADTVWDDTRLGKITASIAPDGYDGTPCLKFTKSGEASASWHSVSIDLLPFVKDAGDYILRFHYRVIAEDPSAAVYGLIRTDKKYSFSVKSDSQYFAQLPRTENRDTEEWYDYEVILKIKDEDLKAAKGSGYWLFCFDRMKEGVTEVYIDDFELRTQFTTASADERFPERARTWIAEEIVLLSGKTYDDPYRDVDVDLVLTNGSTTLIVPGFWDGGNVWRIRFACTKAGTWSYKTVCTDPTDAGLNGRTGTIECAAYEGNLDVYKRGFVKTEPGKTYFVYDDGTPFFYLGDTHWGLSGESLSQVKKTVETRVKQGFTVLQSEPLGSEFDLTDGVSAMDLSGMQKNDDLFAAIAAYGFVHTNAEFFFSSSMQTFVGNFGGFKGKSAGTLNGKEYFEASDRAKAELERLSRYWVAHYAAYPVMWTLAQEVDKNFYLNEHENQLWCELNSPYKLVAEYVAKYDPYNHPLTAHMENYGSVRASKSAFRDVAAHTWYAVQWSQSFDKDCFSYEIPVDFWAHNQGKPVVLYESKYCYLWTKNFGARVQGWMAFLNGMCGYGWGGQDTWCYQSVYDESKDSTDNVDVITSAEKIAATWEDSLQYDSCFQVGYMRDFFENTVGEWYDLVPRFDDPRYLISTMKMSFIASNEANSKIVVYFYNFSDASLALHPNSTAENASKTGLLRCLNAGEEYHYLWFNAVTGQTGEVGTFTAEANGSWQIPDKANGDMVLYVYK